MKAGPFSLRKTETVDFRWKHYRGKYGTREQATKARNRQQTIWHEADRRTQRTLDRERLAAFRAERVRPPVPVVHQVIRTFPAVVPGTIALSFFRFGGM